jgi:multidrug efflux pump subunit AcrB
MLYESFIHRSPSSHSSLSRVGAWSPNVGRFDLSVMGITGSFCSSALSKNGIMLVDFAIHRENDGHSPLAAIRKLACFDLGRS